MVARPCAGARPQEHKSVKRIEPTSHFLLAGVVRSMVLWWQWKKEKKGPENEMVGYCWVLGLLFITDVSSSILPPRAINDHHYYYYRYITYGYYHRFLVLCSFYPLYILNSSNYWDQTVLDWSDLCQNDEQSEISWGHNNRVCSHWSTDVPWLTLLRCPYSVPYLPSSYLHLRSFRPAQQATCPSIHHFTAWSELSSSGDTCWKNTKRSKVVCHVPFFLSSWTKPDLLF